MKNINLPRWSLGARLYATEKASATFEFQREEKFENSCIRAGVAVTILETSMPFSTGGLSE